MPLSLSKPKRLSPAPRFSPVSVQSAAAPGCVRVKHAGKVSYGLTCSACSSFSSCSSFWIFSTCSKHTEQLSLKVRGHHTGLTVTPYADVILLCLRIRHLVLLQNFPRCLLLLQLLDGFQFLRIEQNNCLQQIRLEGFNLLMFDFQAADADFIAVPFPLTLFKFLIFLSISGSPLPLLASDWLWLTGAGAD